MTRFVVRAVAACLFGVLILSVAACGGGDDDDGDPSATSSAERSPTRSSGSGTAAPTGEATQAGEDPAVEGAVAILTAAAGGESVPAPTLQAAQTALAAATAAPVGTPAPQATPAPGETVVPRSTSAPREAALLSIDVDVTNGTGPCDIVDASVSVDRGANFVVAVCVESPEVLPVEGLLTAIDVQLDYGSVLVAAAGSGDGINDLDSNPDLNQGPAIGGAEWDCNVLDQQASAPKASPSPARLVCNTADFQPNEVRGESIAIALVRMTAESSGTANLALSGNSGILAGRYESLCVDSTAECRSATVEVR